MKLVQVGRHHHVNPEQVVDVRFDSSCIGVSIYLANGKEIWMLCPTNVSTRQVWANKLLEDLQR